MNDYDEENKDVFEDFIGASIYGYGVPYIIDREKMIEHFNLTNDYFTEVFGININEMKSLNTVSFWLACYDEEEWEIHYHMYYDNPTKERHNMFNPTITDENGESLIFKTREDAEKFLIDLLDKIVLDVNGFASKEKCKEIMEDIAEQYDKIRFYNDAINVFNNKNK